MNWHHLWYDPENNRLRCGWRVASFTGLAVTFSILLANLGLLMVYPLLPHAQPALDYVKQLILAVAVIIVFISLGIWALRTFDRLPAHTLGLPVRGPWVPTIGIGFCIGIGLITLLLLVLHVLGYAAFTWHHPTRQALGVLSLLILGLLISAMAEEVVFHGYLFQTLLRGIGPLATLLLTSMLFALIHLGNTPQLHLLGLVNIGLAGVMFGMLYLRMGTLWLLIGMHAGWNFAQFFFGLPSSGITLALSTPLTTTLAAIPWLTGGTFGLEGGAGISVLLLGLLAIITYSRRGMPLASYWWEWRELAKTLTASPPWDFTID